MPDMEKVVKEYEDYVNSYISLTTSQDYEFEMHKAVLAMLKEQEAAEPLFNKIMKHFICPNCSLVLDEGRDDYCPSCGKEIAWDEYYIHEDDCK